MPSRDRSNDGDDIDEDHERTFFPEDDGDRDSDGDGNAPPTRRRARKTPRKPRPVTLRYLGNVAKWYIERYQPCSGQLRRALMKRVHRGLAEHGGDRDEALAWVEEVIAHQISLGAIQDADFALAWANSYQRRGVALRDIQQRLRAKDLPAAVIEAALQALRADQVGDPDLAAVCAYVRRRRFGPFRLDPAQRAARAEKDLAAVARAGHRFDLARRVLTSEDLDAFLLLEEQAGEAPEDL